MANVIVDIAKTIEQLASRVRRLEKLVTRRRVAACRVYNNANISHAESSKWASVTFDSERSDVSGMHSTSTNTSRITAPNDGWYHIFGHIEFAANATGQRGIGIRLDGSTYIARDVDDATASGTMSMSVSTDYYLTSSQYVELMAYQSSGGALNILATGNYSPEFGATLSLDRP